LRALERQRFFAIRSEAERIRAARLSGSNTENARPVPLLVKPREAWRLLNCSNTRGYELIAARELESFLDGRSRKITMKSIHHYIEHRLTRSLEKDKQPSKSKDNELANEARRKAMLNCPPVERQTAPRQKADERKAFIEQRRREQERLQAEENAADRVAAIIVGEFNNGELDNLLADLEIASSGRVLAQLVRSAGGDFAGAPHGVADINRDGGHTDDAAR
jgi:hypothetical protein